MTDGVSGDVARLSSLVAQDESCSDYDLWRALKTLDNQLYRIERSGLPVPIRVIYARRILEAARAKRAASAASGSLP